MDTLGFKEKESGWVSFFSYKPQGFLRIGGTAFTIYNGNLWKQNDKSNPVTNTFFGVKYSSKIATVFNDSQIDDKIFKTFFIEGSSSWNVVLKTNLTETSLNRDDFDKKESRYFAYLRGNENENDLSGNSNGIGVCIEHTEDEFKFASNSVFTNIGDKLYALDNEEEVLLGIIIDKTENSLRIDRQSYLKLRGLFFFSTKNNRIDGAEIRGYYANVELENNDDKQVELFAVNSNVVKSYV